MMRISVRIVVNERGGYTAICPSLPGCIATGRTRQQARKKLDEAICGYFAAVTNFVPEHVPYEVVEVTSVA